MPISTLLVANRGEIAIRVLHTAAELGIRTVAVFAADDADCAHLAKADEAYELARSGVAAYTDVDALLAAAERGGCDAVHPGYGFLSENPEFARRCREAGLTFVGPRAELLEMLGNKSRARAHARELGIGVLDGTQGPTNLNEACAFLEGLGSDGAVMVKALDGGGGRGIRPARTPGELAEAFERCTSESRSAGGDGSLYVERMMPDALHIEVQVLGDGSGTVAHLGERDCSVQRRRQKLIEMAPSPLLTAEARSAVCEAATALAHSVRYENAGTVEFLVRQWSDSSAPEVVFLEVNPRVQVEHPVTEEITGVDLVATQLQLAAGNSLADLGLEQDSIPSPRGIAVQTRINAERVQADGSIHPASGSLTRFQPPSGRGVRVDTHGYAGHRANPRYDSLLAKIITHGSDQGLRVAAARAERALHGFDIVGLDTNIGLQQAILTHPAFLSGEVNTGFVDANMASLLAASGHAPLLPSTTGHEQARPAEALEVPDGAFTVTAPITGVVVSAPASEGALLRSGEALVVLEAMKMEHVVAPDHPGQVLRMPLDNGDTVAEGDVLAVLAKTETAVAADDSSISVDPDHIRADLAEVIERHGIGLDEARPEAVERRRRLDRRTARENIADLCDDDSFVEYGALAIAAQRSRKPLSELIERTPADGMVTGIGSVNGETFGADRARCAVMSYDYTVLAGTQGMQNHRKKDRMFAIAERERLPVVLFAEGGGGRPGDTDTMAVAGLDEPTFHAFAKLSGTVPLVGIVSGRCFAGNAALAGCCDVIIATREASLGMGGPAMIEGGGLGAFDADDVGPMSVQAPNGVVDVLAADDAEAVSLARGYLAYFQGPVSEWSSSDQRVLRQTVPENRVRVYDVRDVLHTLADAGSVLELRASFGVGIRTALARIEGRPVAVLANNPSHLGGAIDGDAADKAARFLQLCGAFGLPVVSLCDTPGFMVGPDAERTATVRRFSRMFVAGANIDVPMCTVVLRKGYGLGAMAMAGGSLKAPLSTVAWPSGEFGGMGLEGAVRLGYRPELDAISDPDARRARYDELVAEMYEKGKALSTAAAFEIDDVIDPAETRAHIAATFASASRERDTTARFVDTW